MAKVPASAAPNKSQRHQTVIKAMNCKGAGWYWSPIAVDLTLPKFAISFNAVLPERLVVMLESIPPQFSLTPSSPPPRC